MTVFAWTKKVVGAGLLPGAVLLLSAGACGDSGDGECVPSVHRPCEGEIGITSPEGGTIFFERMRFSPELGAAGLPPTAYRLMAQFTNDMAGDALPLPTVGQCNDMVSSKVWFTGTGDNATYVDIGDLEISAPTPFSTSKITTGDADMLARVHDIYYQYFGPGESDMYTTPDAWQDVTFTGSADYAAHTFENALYMPPDFNVISPAFEATEIQLGEDFEGTWEFKEPADSSVETFGFGILLAPDGATIHHFCVEPNDGSITIDKDTLDTFAAEFPDGALMIRGNFTHNIVTYDDGAEIADRRIDMVAVNCYIQPISFLPAL